MIDHRKAPSKRAMRHVAGAAALTATVLLGGCSGNEAPAGSRLRVYAADVTGGARSCSVPKLNPAAGTASEASIKLSNDGGWCGIPVHQAGPKPFDAGLLTRRAMHGNVTIHEVGDETRIDYTPDRGFAGADSFDVKLIPGDATIAVTVTVVMPGA